MAVKRCDFEVPSGRCNHDATVHHNDKSCGRWRCEAHPCHETTPTPERPACDGIEAAARETAERIESHFNSIIDSCDGVPCNFTINILSDFAASVRREALFECRRLWSVDTKEYKRISALIAAGPGAREKK